METRTCEIYSGILQRGMPIRVYGHAGKPVLFIPCQNGHACDFENFGMANALSGWIEGGRIRVYAIDTIDAETWSNVDGDPGWRIRQHERWIEHIVRELVPFLRHDAGLPEDPTRQPGLMVFGCSLGAAHAFNLYLRFPDLFDRCLALSGVYHASYFFGNYMDEVVYRNSPADYLVNFPADHPYVEKYNRNRAVVCTGQGDWEEAWSTREIEPLLRDRGIRVWVDYWGFDVNHDWPWWFRQANYFLPYLLD